MNALLAATNVPQVVTALVNSKEGIRGGCPCVVPEESSPGGETRGSRTY